MNHSSAAVCRRTFLTHSQRTRFSTLAGILACALLTGVTAGCRQKGADRAAVSGDYACRSMGSGPCDTQTHLRLTSNGNWGWAGYGGHYSVSGGRVSFDGAGGPAAWGTARIGVEKTLTFRSGQMAVVWQQPSSTPLSLAGTYVCHTAPGGCQTGLAIVLRPDGTWSWGAGGGSYVIVGGKVQFSGLSSGPAGWGAAAFDQNSITFQASSGSSQWRKQ